MMLLMPCSAQAAFGLTAEDADRFVAPQAFDEPAPLGWTRVEVGRARDGQRRVARGRRRGHRDDLVRGGAGGLGRAGRCSALVMAR
jgi:hypothetical protein